MGSIVDFRGFWVNLLGRRRDSGRIFLNLLRDSLTFLCGIHRGFSWILGRFVGTTEGFWKDLFGLVEGCFGILWDFFLLAQDLEGGGFLKDFLAS